MNLTWPWLYESETCTDNNGVGCLLNSSGRIHTLGFQSFQFASVVSAERNRSGLRALCLLIHHFHNSLSFRSSTYSCSFSCFSHFLEHLFLTFDWTGLKSWNAFFVCSLSNFKRIEYGCYYFFAWCLGHADNDKVVSFFSNASFF